MSTEQDLGIVRTHRWLGEPNDSHYIPAWYEPHTNLDLEVMHLGVGQGFPIRKVLPFRRWALDAQGNTLVRHDFKEKYQLYLRGFKAEEALDLRNEAIPSVRNFVRMKYDRVGSLVDMDFEDDGAIQKTEKYTQYGEIAPEYLLKNQEKSDKLAKTDMLLKLAKDGTLTPAQFQEKVSELLGATMALDESATEPETMIPAPARRRGRPKGSPNRPRVDYGANP